mgnify:CR=1 FL=1
MASIVHYREISYIVDLLLWNAIVGKIYYRDSPNYNTPEVNHVFMFTSVIKLFRVFSLLPALVYCTAECLL